MTVKLTNKKITRVDGKPLQLPRRNDDGEPIRKPKDDWEDSSRPEFEMEETDVIRALRFAILAIPRDIIATNDPLRVSQVFNQLEAAEEHKNGALELSDKAYEWLHHLFNRELPLVSTDKDRGLRPVTYAYYLWQLSSHTVVRQLRSEDDLAKDIAKDD